MVNVFGFLLLLLFGFYFFKDEHVEVRKENNSSKEMGQESIANR